MSPIINDPYCTGWSSLYTDRLGGDNYLRIGKLYPIKQITTTNNNNRRAREESIHTPLCKLKKLIYRSLVFSFCQNGRKSID